MTSEDNVSKENLRVEGRPPSLSKALRVFLLLATVIIITITLVLTLKKPIGMTQGITQAELQQEIQAVQAQLPARIDQYTELKSVETGEMQIKYSFVVTDDPTTLSGGRSIKDDNFAQQIEATVKSSACINKKTRRYINSDVSLAYLYINKDNAPVADFVIPAGFCK